MLYENLILNWDVSKPDSNSPYTQFGVNLFLFANPALNILSLLLNSWLILSSLVHEEDGDKNKSKRVISDPKAQGYYHIEYYLLPTDADPNKTDITLFGIAAKIYPEKQDAKAMKTWTEGNKTWVAWTHWWVDSHYQESWLQIDSNIFLVLRGNVFTTE